MSLHTNSNEEWEYVVVWNVLKRYLIIFQNMEKLIAKLQDKQSELEEIILAEELKPIEDRKCLILYKEWNSLLKKAIEKLKDSELYKD